MQVRQYSQHEHANVTEGVDYFGSLLRKISKAIRHIGFSPPTTSLLWPSWLRGPLPRSVFSFYGGRSFSIASTLYCLPERSVVKASSSKNTKNARL